MDKVQKTGFTDYSSISVHGTSNEEHICCAHMSARYTTEAYIWLMSQHMGMFRGYSLVYCFTSVIECYSRRLGSRAPVRIFATVTAGDS
jgi:hypothetical protein